MKQERRTKERQKNRKIQKQNLKQRNEDKE